MGQARIELGQKVGSVLRKPVQVTLREQRRVLGQRVRRAWMKNGEMAAKDPADV